MKAMSKNIQSILYNIKIFVINFKYDKYILNILLVSDFASARCRRPLNYFNLIQ
jgi:hypothetical protein